MYTSVVLLLFSLPRPRVSKLWPMDQIWTIACFCTTTELEIVLNFEKLYDKKKNMQQRSTLMD